MIYIDREVNFDVDDSSLPVAATYCNIYSYNWGIAIKPAYKRNIPFFTGRCYRVLVG